MPHRIQGTYLKNPFNCNLYLVNSCVLILLLFQKQYPHQIQAGAKTDLWNEWQDAQLGDLEFWKTRILDGNRGKSYLCCIWRHLVVAIWQLKYLWEGLSAVIDGDFRRSGSDFRNLTVPWFRKRGGKEKPPCTSLYARSISRVVHLSFPWVPFSLPAQDNTCFCSELRMGAW